MPTFVHDVHQIWIENELYNMRTSGFLAVDEKKKYLKRLSARVGHDSSVISSYLYSPFTNPNSIQAFCRRSCGFCKGTVFVHNTYPITKNAHRLYAHRDLAISI